MRNFTVYLAVLAICLFVFSSVAQVPKDSKGHIILNSKGDVYFDGVKTGTVSKDRIIRDSKGKKLGFVNSNGILSNEKGELMGKLGKDGKTYFDANDNILFTIEDYDKETCNIKDSKGIVIGNVHKSLKGVACALHCFQNQMDMKKHEKHSNH
ncbi:hypothetical protein EWU23_11885 [Cytophagaceae bacterium 50C-KIRBA]|uniref:WG repeat-containing protein n=1 Tax=Aquirufa beregesia TaxID=2516556 RepID=A0ABX0EX68_9BACT|nr:hypothetical protein [Aquirufa beregesia]NGZ45176.1 hypothetical protein [Aquirufa beregesia]